jgi:hypothetical protein
VALDVELEDLLVEALRPPSSQNVDVLALGNRSRVGEGEEQLRRQNTPLVHLRVVYFYCGESFFPVVAPEDIDPPVANNSSECASGSIQAANRPPVLVEDVVGLAASHALVLPIVAANHIDLPIEIDARVLLPGKVHRLLSLESVLLPWTIQKALV